MKELGKVFKWFLWTLNYGVVAQHEQPFFSRQLSISYAYVSLQIPV